ncbi:MULTISPECIES: DUF3618 domain-containing protein [unclassified Streptomyces]|uniref:DUF3618 domain-containing protein n=1 Tax=unclassified Streptomyces TaxID=2593676 RepID=UPI0036EAF4CD
MTNRTTPDVTGGAKGPEELRRQIERTRRQLGDTVEELAGRADVKGRAMARAADLRDKAGAMTVQLRSTVAQAGHVVQDRAGRTGHVVQERAAGVRHTVQGRAGHAGHAVEHHAPRPVRGVVRTGLRNPRPVLVVGAVVGLIVVEEMLRRRR